MTSTFDEADVVERRAARLKTVLSATDAPARAVSFPGERVARALRRRVLVRRLGMAAAVALLLVGAGVPPVRAWIVSSARALWNSLAPARVTPPAPAHEPPAAVLLGAVRIPVADAFALRVAKRQAQGELAIELTADTVVTVAIRGERDAAELVVLPDGVRLNNDRASSASYLVRVPAGIGRLTVQVGAAAPRVLKPGATDRWTIDLGAAPRNDR